MSINKSFGLNLRILSFQLSSNLFKQSDEIRVSVTTIPEENKQNFSIPAHKMKEAKLTFGVNVNICQQDIPNDFVLANTEKIVVVFRKKNFFSNPIIASTVITAKSFPKNLSEPATAKIFDIFEPINNKNNNNKCRKIVGKMIVEMSLTDPFQLNELKNDKLCDLTCNSLLDDGGFIDNFDEKHKNNFFGFKMLDN